MQCDYCKNKATVYFTQIIDGVSKKASLCETCASQQGVTDPEVFLMDGKGANEKKGENEPSKKSKENDELVTVVAGTVGAATKEVVCLDCGFTLEDLKRIGRLGCSSCYTVFRKDLMHSLSNMHKGISHQGRVPDGMMESLELQQKEEKLIQDLDKAIKDEEYEKAAVLRDQLTKLREGEISTGS